MDQAPQERNRWRKAAPTELWFGWHGGLQRCRAYGAGRGVFDFLGKVKNVNVFQLLLRLYLGKFVELALNLRRLEPGLFQLKYLEKMGV